MKKIVVFSLILSVFCSFCFAKKIIVSGIENESFEKTNDEKIKRNLEALEQIEKSKIEDSIKNQIEQENKPKKVSEDDIYEPLESIGINTENYGRIKKVSDSIQNEKSVAPEKIEKKEESKKIEEVKNVVEKSKQNDVVVEKTSAGVRLSLQNIQFKSNSSELLEKEKKRLNEIAKILKKYPKSKFLVEGHTARVGDKKGEQELSEERARKIAKELTNRGIPSKSFICKGYGGTKPIASNKYKATRAKNRRVDITILEN